MSEDPNSPQPEPTPTPEPTPAGNWYDNLDPDLKNHPSVTKFKEPGSLAKSYVELEKLVGQDKVVLPNEKSTPEEVAAFYDKLGVPGEPAAYEAPQLEGVPDELVMKDGQLEAFKVFAKEHNLNKDQFNALYSFYHNAQIQTVEQLQAQMAEAVQRTETELRGEWGDAYEPKVDAAQQMINQFFGGKLNEQEQRQFGALANSKGFIQAMAEIAENVKEDTLKGVSQHTRTPAQAQSELNEIMGDFSHPYYNNAHPEHSAAIDKVLALQQAATAGEG